MLITPTQVVLNGHDRHEPDHDYDVDPTRPAGTEVTLQPADAGQTSESPEV